MMAPFLPTRFGWLVANAGSGLQPNYRAVVVFVTTNMSASVGGITWAFLDYVRHKPRRFSALGFCCGAVCGLVAVTPASGYVSPTSSIAFGFIGALLCNLSLSVKKLLHVDDAFDVFCVHGVGGIVGNLLTAVFAQKSVAAVDGTMIKGGWLDGHWAQIKLQAIDTAAGFSWSFFVTLALVWLIDRIPGLSLRVNPRQEEIGLDQTELGESMYQHIEDLKGTTVTNCHGSCSTKENGVNGGFVGDHAIELSQEANIRTGN